MSESVIQSLCYKEVLLGEPEPPPPPPPVLLGALGYFIHGCALNNFQAEARLWQGAPFCPGQLGGFVLDVTLQTEQLMQHIDLNVCIKGSRCCLFFETLHIKRMTRRGEKKRINGVIVSCLLNATKTFLKSFLFCGNTHVIS